MIRPFAFMGLAAVAALFTAAPAFAQTSQPVSSTIEIHQSLNVTAVQPLRVKVDGGATSLGLNAIELLDGPTLIEVSGDANRVYRIELIGAATEVTLDIWSANTGDISDTRIAVMNSEGTDLIRISGDRAAIADILASGARIPLSIQYE